MQKKPDVPLDQRLLVSPAEAAALLGVAYATIYERMNRGELPSFKLGQFRRIKRADLDAWVARQGVPTNPPEARR